jgi:hypothetical protein
MLYVDDVIMTSSRELEFATMLKDNTVAFPIKTENVKRLTTKIWCDKLLGVSLQ